MQATFWNHFLYVLDEVPPVSKWMQIFVSVTMLGLCVGLLTLLCVTEAIAMQLPPPRADMSSLQVSQAVNSAQIAQLSADVATNRQELTLQRSQISELKDGLATVRGVGYGFSGFMVLLQFMQIFMTLRGTGSSKSNGHRNGGQ